MQQQSYANVTTSIDSLESVRCSAPVPTANWTMVLPMTLRPCTVKIRRRLWQFLEVTVHITNLVANFFLFIASSLRRRCIISPNYWILSSRRLTQTRNLPMSPPALHVGHANHSDNESRLTILNPFVFVHYPLPLNAQTHTAHLGAMIANFKKFAPFCSLPSFVRLFIGSLVRSFLFVRCPLDSSSQQSEHLLPVTLSAQT